MAYDWTVRNPILRLWRKDGTWERINSALREEVRVAARREPEPSAAVLDSQSVKTTEPPGVRGYDVGKKINGRKRHLLVDTLGLLLMVSPALDVVQARVHAANIQGRDGAKLLLEKAKPRDVSPTLRR